MDKMQYLKAAIAILVGFWMFFDCTADQVAANTDVFFEDSKVKHYDGIIKDFAHGNSTSRVIVNLARPEGFGDIVEQGRLKKVLRTTVLRKNLEEAIKGIQTKVANRIDPNKVRIREMFRYASGFSAEVTLEGLDALAQNEEVVTIEKDQILEAHLAQGIPLINASVARNSYNGSGIAIAICDTGIDYSHPTLGGGGFPNNKVLGGYDCGDDDDDPMDELGHGTCCAGIAAGDIGTTGDYIGGVAPSAKLYALKISSGDQDFAYTSDIIEAWEWCITHQQDDPQHPIMIISTSFGGGQYTTECDGTSVAMTEAAANALAAGITLFASSGNDGYCNAISHPACISHVVSVGAVYDSAFGTFPPCVSPDSCVTKYSTQTCETGYYATDATSQDVVASYSNTATFLDLLAPSNRTYTTDITGSSGYAHGDYFSSFGGTSASCPYAAGAAACLQSAAWFVTGSYLTPEEVRSRLTTTGTMATDAKVGHAKPRINLGFAIDAVGLPPLCECDIVPDATVVSRGGTLGFQTSITNNTGGFGTVLFGTKVTKPDLTQTGFIWGPLEVWLNPDQTRSGHKTHTVPSGFELGIYTYHGYVGRYGNIYDECHFDFEVVP